MKSDIVVRKTPQGVHENGKKIYYLLVDCKDYQKTDASQNMYAHVT